MRDYKFSYFFNPTLGPKNTEPKGIKTLGELFLMVKESPSLESLIKEYRETGDPQIKNRLPFFTPCGVMSKKNDKTFISEGSATYNWVIPFDIDKKDNLNLSDKDWEDLFVNKISANPCVLFAFTSPSGGIKGLVVAEENSYLWFVGERSNTPKVFKEFHYPYLEKLWGVQLDKSQATLTQSMFLSHDPYVHCNVDALPLSLPTDKVSMQNVMLSEGMEDMDISWFLSKCQYTQHNIWENVSKHFWFLGKHAGAGIIGEEVYDKLVEAFKKNPYPKDHNDGIMKFRRSWERGKQEPIDPKWFQTKKTLDAARQELRRFTVDEKLPFVRVGGNYIRIRYNTQDDGVELREFISWGRQQLIDDYGTKDILYQIPKYDKFANNADYFPKSVDDRDFNTFVPLTFQPTKGDFPTIKLFLEHIWGHGEKLEEAYDYHKLLLCNPKQLLPIICLVSKEQGTGKTTYFNLLSYIYRGNTAIISAEQFEDRFNLSYALKHLIMIDEGSFDTEKKKVQNKIKQWTTQSMVSVEEKFMPRTDVEYNGRVLIATNAELDFFKIEDSDVRFWVKKINRFDSFDPQFLDKMRAEIPYFTQFLMDREMFVSKSEGRFYFGTTRTRTEQLDRIIENSIDHNLHFLRENLADWFVENPSETHFTSRLADICDWINKPGQTKYIQGLLLKLGGSNVRSTRVNSLGMDKSKQNQRWWQIPRTSVEDLLGGETKNSIDNFDTKLF